ncbi:MAG: hypothetical protein H0S85_07505 [Desulfovibrionaceae bacterium]|jgi:hypothetical protein|nr:hypothetical protein [Desulfovibrionaceae bacterium]
MMRSIPYAIACILLLLAAAVSAAAMEEYYVREDIITVLRKNELLHTPKRNAAEQDKQQRALLHIKELTQEILPSPDANELMKQLAEKNDDELFAVLPLLDEKPDAWGKWTEEKHLYINELCNTIADNSPYLFKTDNGGAQFYSAYKEFKPLSLSLCILTFSCWHAYLTHDVDQFLNSYGLMVTMAQGIAEQSDMFMHFDLLIRTVTLLMEMTTRANKDKNHDIPLRWEIAQLNKQLPDMFQALSRAYKGEMRLAALGNLPFRLEKNPFLLSRIRYEKDCLRYIKTLQKMIRISENTSSDPTKIYSTLKRLTGTVPFKTPLIDWSKLFPQMFALSYQLSENFTGIIVNNAVDMYAHRNGNRPTSLQELVPEYLEEIPVRPYSDIPYSVPTGKKASPSSMLEIIHQLSAGN